MNKFGCAQLSRCLSPFFTRLHIFAGVAVLLLIALPQMAWAVTYANVSVPINWIDPSTHIKLGPTTGGVYSPLYRFSNTGGCGTTQPTIDDTLSDNIPLGFNFIYSGVSFSSVRIMSNGRLQFNNNTTCGFGSPVTQLPYPNAGLNYTMRIYGNDLDPTLQSEGGYSTTCTNRNTCYVSYATLGTAPYRSFVVTWNNVPEWAAGGSTSGNYNLQIILQENGEFIYQYGVNTPGPGNTTAQVGWQANSADYNIPSIGYPASNSALKFYIPAPVAEYRMEQPSWNGTVNEVFDTSGNGRHGVSVGTAQTTASGYSCRGANIPSNTNTGTISAINSGINIPSTVGGNGTITFWYRPTLWVGANSDAQLFDATTASPNWFFLVKQRVNDSNSRLIFAIRDSAGNDRIAQTGNLTNSALSAGGWVHIAVSWNFNNLAGANPDHLRIYVNGVQQVESAFATTGSVSASINTLYIGDNRSGTIGLGGTGRSANGVLDEFRIYNYEGGVALVQRDKDQAAVACLAHYAISHAGTGTTCQANSVTITAHDASHNTILMPNNTTTINLSTSTVKGDWSVISGYGTLNNGTANDGSASYLFNGEYQVVLGLTHTTPGTVNVNVTDGQVVESEDPLLTLTSCVGKFNACHNYATSSCSAASGRVYTRLAASAFASDVVALNNSDAVETSFTGKVNVSLIARATPGGIDAQNCFTPDYTQTLDAAVTSFTAGRLTFASTTVPSAYRDARFKFVCDSTNCPPSGMTWCSVDDFAIRPQAFTVSSTNANADSTGVSTSATPIVKAGTNFSLTATAVAGYGSSPKLDSLQVVAHSGAVATGTLGPLTNPFGTANSLTGVATGSSFTYGEVGYFRLNANGVYDDTFTAVDQPSDCTDDFSNSLVGGKYGCKFGNTAATSYFGRFTPDHFALTPGAVTPGCSGSFTYFGQDGVATAFTLIAQNATNGLTQNYTGSFAKLALTNWNNFGFTSDAPAGSTPSASATAPSGTWGAGTTSSLTATHIIGRPTALPAAPGTSSVTISAAPVDTDGVTMTATAVAPATPLYFGRLWLGNAYGSDKLDLVIPFESQYWNGSAFVKNTNDSCTALASGNIALGNQQGGLTAYTGPITGSTAISGAGSITLTKPSSAAAGSVDLLVNLGLATPANCSALSYGTSTSASLGHLAGNWCSTGYNRDPTARATFGIYGSSLKKGPIYIRESY